MSIVSNHRFMLLVLAGVSAAALGIAYIAQYGFDLAPCVLCLYQRVPYAMIVLMGLAGYALNQYPRAFLGVISLTFAANAMIAFYHTGVEQKWWRSFLEGCSTPDLSGSIDDLMARIESAPVIACDSIPWQDPLLSLSMANWNVVFCLFFTGLALWAVRR